MNHTNQSVGTATRKRKDREGVHQNSSFYTHKGSFGNKSQYQHQRPNKGPITNTFNSFTNTTSFGVGSSEPGSGSSNRILAGYMAHEFLTKGTLFGQKFDPARAEAVPVSAAEQKRKSVVVEPVGVKPSRSYTEVAKLLMGSDATGTHIPGIVNPTQLGRWIRM